MAYVSADLTLAGETSPRQGALSAALGTFRGTVANYLQKRRIYVRTLTELQSYSRRDLLDLGIDPDALPSFARRAAGL